MNVTQSRRFTDEAVTEWGREGAVRKPRPISTGLKQQGQIGVFHPARFETLGSPPREGPAALKS